MTNTWRDEVVGLMEAHKLTQSSIAADLGVSPQYICDVLAGRRNPTPKITDKLCDVYSLPSRVRTDLHRAGAIAAGWIWI